MIIYSGIEKENIEKVLKLMKIALLKMEKGDFSNDDMNAAVLTMVNSVEASLDSPFGMISQAMSQALINPDDINTKIKKYQNIKKEEIIAVAKKVKLHTVLTLEQGGSDEEDKS